MSDIEAAKALYDKLEKNDLLDEIRQELEDTPKIQPGEVTTSMLARRLDISTGKAQEILDRRMASGDLERYKGLGDLGRICWIYRRKKAGS